MRKRLSIGLVYLFVFCIIATFLYKAPLFGDDLANTRTFTGGINLGKDFNLVYNQYYNWSSRTLVNFVMFFFESTPKIVFCIVTGILVCLTIYVINYFVNTPHARFVDFMIVVLAILTFPIIYMYTAGWIATTTTYFYPIAFSLIALYLTCQNVQSRVKNTLVKIVAFVLWLYSFNNEQLAVTALPLVCIAVVCEFKKKEKFLMLE